MDAFVLITMKLENIDMKLSNVVTTNQMTNQMQVLKSQIMVDFERHIADMKLQFEKLENENTELKKRVSELEQLLKSVSNTSKQPDIAFRRISFIGFPLSDELGRVKCITEWVSQHFPGVVCTAGNISKGPVRDRKLTAISYAEFSDADLRNSVLKSIRSSKLSCSFKGNDILIKPALSQLIRDRIWAFNTAYNLVANHVAAKGKTVVKRIESHRAILVDGVIAFDHSSSIGMGTFMGAFSSLALPGKAAS